MYFSNVGLNIGNCQAPMSCSFLFKIQKCLAPMKHSLCKAFRASAAEKIMFRERLKLDAQAACCKMIRHAWATEMAPAAPLTPQPAKMTSKMSSAKLTKFWRIPASSGVLNGITPGQALTKWGFCAKYRGRSIERSVLIRNSDSIQKATN